MKKLVDRNPHTGEALQSKRPNASYRMNFDKIFRQKPITNYCNLCNEELQEWPHCTREDCPNEDKALDAKQYARDHKDEFQNRN